MLIFFEASGAFFLAFRTVFFYYSGSKKDFLSEIAQYYGALTLILTPFWRIKEAPHYIEAWWFYWIIPHWPIMIGGGLLAILYSYLKARN